MRYTLVLMLTCSLIWLTGCEKDIKKDVTIEVPEGISFSPVKPYQEAYPGSIITFRVHVKTSDPVVLFGIRFKFPGASEYVSLPQYPDMTETSEFTAGNGEFEYALPPSDVSIDEDMKFKFIGVTANKTYEKEYTVRMKSTGLQAARLYKPSDSRFKFSSLDLLNTAGVPESSPALTKDIIAYMKSITYTGKDYPVIAGFSSANDTKFKLADANKFNQDPSKYAATYSSISSANEFTTLSVDADVLLPGMGLLKGNTYYIAKVNRDNVFSYVGIKVVSVPSTSLVVSGPIPVQNPAGDVVDLQLKK